MFKRAVPVPGQHNVYEEETLHAMRCCYNSVDRDERAAATVHIDGVWIVAYSSVVPSDDFGNTPAVILAAVHKWRVAQRLTYAGGACV